MKRYYGLVMVVLLLVLAGCGGAASPATGMDEAPAAERAAELESSESDAMQPTERAAEEASGEEGMAPFATHAPAAPDAAPQADRASQYEAVTAGVVDDNAQWQSYLDYWRRNGTFAVGWRDISERYRLQVQDEQQRPVHDANVQIFADQALVFEGRTDSAGWLLFHPRALDSAPRGDRFQIVAAKGEAVQEAAFGRDGGSEWVMTLPGTAGAQQAQLDLLFLIDATGSMGDEIDKLKASMADIADEIGRLPQQPHVRYGLVAYRDRGEAYVAQPFPFTDDLQRFQANLAALQAAGGGDNPEALNEALYLSLNQLEWRERDTVRLVLLVADAPPHMDYQEPYRYDREMQDAARRGIRIFPVGASGLNEEGQYIFRQLAQFTGGKFVFLTYADGSNPGSGPGVETEHDVANYSVSTLDQLVVRLVSEELAPLGGGQ